MFESRKCNVQFTVSVVGLKHVNDENTAVTALKASFFDYDHDTGLLRPDAKNASYQVSSLSAHLFHTQNTHTNTHKRCVHDKSTF